MTYAVNGQTLNRNTPQYNVDVLWLVEHIARELDVACAVKAWAESVHGLRIEIRSLYQHIRDYVFEFVPKVVVHPYVYFVRGALATEEVFARWPSAIHVNAAWEQIHYKAHRTIKAPADEIAKRHVLHLAWGEFYRQYLMQYGVPSENVIVNGHPAYQLYRHPYRSYFRSRDQLAEQYGLDPAKSWIFVPENYRWAFAEKKINFFVSIGGDRAELDELVAYSKPSLRLLLEACRNASTERDCEVILRPRPAVHKSKMLAFFKSELGSDVANLHFIKEGTVREWVIASDAVISSYSTTLLEAAVAGKPAWMFEPIPIPAALHCDWYDSAPRIKSVAEFVGVARGNTRTSGSRSLSSWVEQNLLPDHDPIRALAAALADFAVAAPAKPILGNLPDHFDSRAYFNEESHEMDSFTPQEAAALSAQWRKHLFGAEGTK